MGIVRLVAVAAVMSCALAGSPSAARLDAHAVDAWMSQQMRRDAIPAAAVAIVQDDAVALLRGYGAARPGEPMGPGTPMLIGSVSKSFTALAVMQLAEQGTLDLDAPVTRYLPWFRVAEPGFAERIRVRHLLNHTSGLTDRTFVDAAHLRDDADLGDLARALAAARPSALPGERFQYFNANYSLLGLLVETVSGESYAAYMRRHVFGPLGMTRTTAEPRSVRNLARGHLLAFGLAWPASQALPDYGTPAGYIVSTASDMSRYARALLNGGELDGARVLKASSVARLWSGTPAVPGYGMGWFLGSDAGGRRIEHGGANETFKAEVVLHPDRGDAVVLLVAQDNLLSAFTAYPTMRDGLVALALGRPPPEPGPSARWPGAILTAVMAGLLAIATVGVARAGRWARRSVGWSRWRRWLALVFPPVIPLLAVPLAVAGLQSWLGRGFHWTAAAMLPDAVVVACVWWLGEVAVTVARIVRLVRLDRSPTPVGRGASRAGDGSVVQRWRRGAPARPRG